MLGHQLVASYRGRHQVYGTVRNSLAAYGAGSDHMPPVLLSEVDAKNVIGVADAIDQISPDAVVNAIGIVKQRDDAKSAIESIEVNSLFPHRLSEMCIKRGVRLVHMSTDCVFSGDTGGYQDNDFADARDLYGRSKYMGEVCGDGVITLRTSIIGLELNRKKSLIEWFLAQTGVIRGYRKAIYSGFTTLEMARIIESLLKGAPAQGVFNVSSEPVDKFSLLCGLRDRLVRNIEIVPDDEFVCDRSLDSTKFRQAFSYMPPRWSVMLDELAAQIRVRDGVEVGS